MLRIVWLATTLSLAAEGANSQTYNANMPEPYEEPGNNLMRSEDASFGVESIDPFTGALKIVVTDLVIPSNGGLDLAVVRNYQSFEQVNAVQVPQRNYQKGRTATGIGWDLHFGRLWRGNSPAAPQLAATNTANACRVFNATSRDNPVLELPDGSRQMFAVSNTSETHFAYISPNRWILRCLPTSLGNAGAIAISPEGIKYTFNFLHRVSNLPISNDIAQQNSNQAFHVTKIEHPNGTSITISYVPVASTFYAALSSASHSEGHSITFAYDNVANQNTAHLRSFSQTRPAAEGGTRTWTFNYVPAVVPPDSEYLESVERPDSRQTSYEYLAKASAGDPNPDGVFSLSQVTTVLGGVVTYTYQQQTFPIRDATTPQPYYVVSKKEVARTGTTVDGTWTYNYRPATNVGETRDFTDISGPTNCITYEHESAPINGSKWRIGLLLSKSIEAPNSSPSTLTCSASILRLESNTWVGQVIADQDYFRPPGLSDAFTNAPRLSAQTVNLDGTNYTRSFDSPDAFGNPTSIVETGVAPAANGTVGPTTRTTSLTYFTDLSVWIIHRLKNETVQSAGLTYATPTSSPVTSGHVIARTYFTSGAKIGLLQRETLAGVSTDFDYFTGATAGGSLNKIIDANGVATATVDDYTTTYSSYKRGQPRSVSRSIDGTTGNVQVIDREIAEAGTLTWEEDGEDKRTTFNYNAVNQLTGVNTARPAAQDDDIVITRSNSNTNDVVKRGNYSEVRQYDGFGALTRTDWSDLTPGSNVQPIFQKTDYDAGGRAARLYLPNATAIASSVRTDYDGLDRPTKITHPGGAFASYAYLSNNRVQKTDERGFVTTFYFRSFGDSSHQELMRVQAERGDTPGSGLTQVTFIDRNKLGQPTSISQEGVTRTFRYNPKFLLFEEVHPEIAVGATVPNVIRYTHDLVGNILTRTVGGVATTQATFALDRLYRIDGVSFVDPTGNVDFDYYKNDELKFVTKAGTRWDYLYDLNNNLTQEKLTLSAPIYSPRTYQLDYGYDRRDARQYVTYPSSSGLMLDYVPDVFGRATRINATQSGATTTGFASGITYYPNGQLHTITAPNGLTTTFGQDTRLRPSSFVTSGMINGTLQKLVDRLYQYDNTSNTTAITDNRVTANTKSMSYDGLNRLRTANGGWGTGSVSYYPTNNIQTKVFAGTSLTFNYSSANRLANVTGTTPLTFAYDVYGNVTTTGRATFGNFTFDDDSQLKSVRDASGTLRIDYNYDGHRQQTLERYTDGWSTRYKAHARTGHILYEEDIVNFLAKDHVYLEGRLVGTRTRCTSSQDTDSDGINDCTEFRIGLLKSSSSDATFDTDGDGLSNLVEVQAGTDIYKADTDADGLSDGYELDAGLNPLVSDSNSDADGDGLSNLAEAGLGTIPTDADTDNDGIPDGSDPNPLYNPAAFVPILNIVLDD